MDQTDALIVRIIALQLLEIMERQPGCDPAAELLKLTKNDYLLALMVLDYVGSLRATIRREAN